MSVITVIMTVVRGHKNICILFIFLSELLFVIVFFVCRFGVYIQEYEYDDCYCSYTHSGQASVGQESV